MVDLLDKNILEVIESYASREKAEGPVEVTPPISISATELKQHLKYNVPVEVVEERLRSLEEGGFLRSEDGKWSLTFKGRMLLEDFWDTLSSLKIVESVEEAAPTVVEAPETEEVRVAPPSTAPELAKRLEELDAKPQQATEFLSELKRSYDAGLISDESYRSFRAEFYEKAGAAPKVKKAIFRRFSIGLKKATLFTSTGVAFLVTGILLIAKIYSPSGLLVLGFDAWILTLALGLGLALTTGIYVSRKPPKNEGGRKVFR